MGSGKNHDEQIAANRPLSESDMALLWDALQKYPSGAALYNRIKDLADAVGAAREEVYDALTCIANADTKYPSMPSGFTGDWKVLRDEARSVLIEDEDGVWG